MTHNTKQALSLTVIAWFLAALALLFLAGCYEAGDDVKNITPPPPTEPVTIDARGVCEARFDDIRCCDTSASQPSGELVEVFWRLLLSQTRVAGEQTGSPGECVTFTDLDIGTYVPEQKVTASDGSSVTRTLDSVTVDGSG